MIILVEGIDGSGKTSFIDQLRQVLSQKGIKSKLYSEYSIPEIKKLIEQLIHSKMYNPYTHLFLAVSAYHLLRQEVLQEHRNGAVVLWDRYIPSTIVYSRMLGVDEQTIQMSISKLSDIIDMAIFCDVTPDCALTRKQVFDNIEVGFQGNNHESDFLDFQTKIYEEFKKIINENNYFWYVYRGLKCEREEILRTILNYKNKGDSSKISI